MNPTLKRFTNEKRNEWYRKEGYELMTQARRHEKEQEIAEPGNSNSLGIKENL